MSTKKYYAIVGRVPDEENVCLVCHATSKRAALSTFTKKLYEDDPRRRAEILDAFGDDAYIDAAFVSESPISISDE